MGGPRAGERTFARPRRLRRAPPPAICPFASRAGLKESSCEKGFGQPLIAIDAGSQLVDVDELVRRVCNVDRAGPEKKRLAPVGEKRNVRRIGYRLGLEPGYCRKSLSGYV